ncbi:beta-ribofuranosylaminobenzene 5'-phosphate synthase family protein [Aurantimonas sp. E1-2-R+4]|uniref:beta-ribofuranosylaminobenzene 5'-phosphate synthase family protein n=1 Tax=Aurantimonas sp. E1-2-R+4 TaxID=3113714 RepID=UPI002F93FADA
MSVTAGSRIHVSLADMGFVSPRAYGGVGFMVNRTASRVELRRNDRVFVEGVASLDEDARRELIELLHSLVEESGVGAAATIKEHAPQHVGFGTKTALKLSIVVGFDELTGSSRDRAAQQRASGRGGASGIGVHGFYEGGILWDAGRPRDLVDGLLPSRAHMANLAPLLMLRIPFPDQWRIGLCMPVASSVHGVDERRFFDENAPIKSNDALRAMALLYHGVLPAFRSVDIKALASAMKAMATVGFKRLEVERCGTPVERLLESLHYEGYAAGMSSMGPLVYVIFDGANDAIAEEIQSICLSREAAWLGSYSGLNRGATVRRLVVA